jgi:hypothetical protein
MTRDLQCVDRSRALARTVSNLLQPTDVKVTENYFVVETIQLILKGKFTAYKRQTETYRDSGFSKYNCR